MSVCKKVLSCTLALAFLLTFLLVLPPQAKAAESGICGDNLTWTLDDSGTLTISGTGAKVSIYVGYSINYSDNMIFSNLITSQNRSIRQIDDVNEDDDVRDER